VLVAALGPAMLKLAGEVADGTITWLVGPHTLRDHIVPSITAAASAAGRAVPRVVVGLPVCVTADPDAARERAARTFGVYKDLPSYRAMLDREGAAGPADVAVVGDEEAVAEQLRRLAGIGATDFAAPLFGRPEERRRTLELLGMLARSGE
jgi:5,10-methylenetetrahydromethanopterin reductase